MRSETAFTAKDPAFAARVRASFGRQKAMKAIGAKLATVLPGVVEIELPFQESLTQQDGFLHAGIATTAVDTACGYAALSLMPPGSEVLTVEFKASFMAPAVGDKFVARGEVLRPGKTVTFCSGQMTAVKGKRRKVIAAMLATMIHRNESAQN